MSTSSWLAINFRPAPLPCPPISESSPPSKAAATPCVQPSIYQSPFLCIRAIKICNMVVLELSFLHCHFVVQNPITNLVNLWGIDLLLMGEYASLFPTHTALWKQNDMFILCWNPKISITPFSLHWRLLSIPMVILVLSIVASPHISLFIEGSLWVSTPAILLRSMFLIPR